MAKSQITFIPSLMWCGSPIGKGSIGQTRLRWEDQVMKDVMQIVLDAEWQVLAMNREVA